MFMSAATLRSLPYVPTPTATDRTRAAWAARALEQQITALGMPAEVHADVARRRAERRRMRARRERANLRQPIRYVDGSRVASRTGAYHLAVMEAEALGLGQGDEQSAAFLDRAVAALALAESRDPQDVRAQVAAAAHRRVAAGTR